MEETTDSGDFAQKLFPGVWAAIGWVALFFVIQIVFNVIAIVVAVALKAGEAELAGQDTVKAAMKLAGDMKFIALPTLWSLVLSSIATLLLLWLYLRKGNRAALLGLDRWSKLSVRQTAIAGFAAMLLAFGFNFVYQTYVFPDHEMQAQLRQLLAAMPHTAFYGALLFLTVAVMAPALEELIFRGLLQRSLANRLPIWAAMLLASAIFAAMHFDVYAFPALFAVGAAFGLLYHLTGSLRVSIALHIVNNSLAMLLPN